LPALTLATVPLAVIARMTRSSLLEVLHDDYIRTARAKGLGGRAVVLRHALRNAAVPIVTVIGLNVGYLLAGAVLTETVFSWPGLGRYVVEAVKAADYNAVQAGLLVTAVSFVSMNLLVDIAYAWIDPRIRVADG
jgi:peptide/nickel transport system permease protein